MKETKKFFVNNRLNKGCSKSRNTKRSDISLIGKKYTHALPPIDMVQEYEELYPGTIEKLLSMSQKEQEHRHNTDLVHIEKYSQAMRSGRVFALIIFGMICLTTLYLASTDSYISASVLAGASFICLTVIATLCTKLCANLIDHHSSQTNRNKKFQDNRKFKK